MSQFSKDNAVSQIFTHQPVMLQQLENLCNLNSGSNNLAGLAQVAAMLEKLFLPIVDAATYKPLLPYLSWDLQGLPTQQPLGDCLFLQKRPDLTSRILLCGHMDTVYGSNHPFQKVTRLDQKHLNGPGVADMKGGLLVILHALSAFEQLPCATNIGWDVLITSDEELGSPSSNQIFAELAPRYQAALVYEPSTTPEGCFAKNRKGAGKFTLIATGKAAHAGRALDQGRNAILYLAETLLAIEALHKSAETGISINIAKIAGGQALNIVPDKAVAQFEVRITEPEQALWVEDALQKLLNDRQRQHPDYTLSLQGGFHRPVKKVNEKTMQLFQRIQAQGQKLGLSCIWEDSGGCCDGNNLSYYGVPVIDTLGVRGGKIHSPEEFMIVDSLAERAALSFLILEDLATQGDFFL